MADCLFCKIVEKKIPAKVVHEDDELVAFEDINPQAPVHILVIPRRHMATLNDASEQDSAALGRLLLAARTLAKGRGIDGSGYRLVETRDVAARDQEEVDRGLRADVLERDDPVVLVDDLHRDPLLGDLAEQAIAHGPAFLQETRSMSAPSGRSFSSIRS
jgi:histidine triad (HIT) family protein